MGSRCVAESVSLYASDWSTAFRDRTDLRGAVLRRFFPMNASCREQLIVCVGDKIGSKSEHRIPSSWLSGKRELAGGSARSLFSRALKLDTLEPSLPDQVLRQASLR